MNKRDELAESLCNYLAFDIKSEQYDCLKQMYDAGWNEALEAAAKEVDSIDNIAFGSLVLFREYMADKIIALKILDETEGES